MQVYTPTAFDHHRCLNSGFIAESLESSIMYLFTDLGFLIFPIFEIKISFLDKFQELRDEI
jgi:hypothetical protein